VGLGEQHLRLIGQRACQRDALASPPESSATGLSAEGHRQADAAQKAGGLLGAASAAAPAIGVTSRPSLPRSRGPYSTLSSTVPAKSAAV